MVTLGCRYTPDRPSCIGCITQAVVGTSCNYANGTVDSSDLFTIIVAKENLIAILVGIDNLFIIRIIDTWLFPFTISIGATTMYIRDVLAQ